MKVTYDPEVDVLRILFRNTPVDESDADKPGVILDYDKEGNIVGLEVLNASQRSENPRGVDYAVPGQTGDRSGRTRERERGPDRRARVVLAGRSVAHSR